MRLTINGRFLAQPVTGVQRYGRELLQALDTLIKTRPEWSIELLTPKLPVPVPAYDNIEVRTVGRLTGHAWEQSELPFYAGGDVLFCPANTAPVATLMSRLPVVVTVHDLSYRYFPSAYTRGFRLVYNALMPIIMARAAGVITVSDAEKAQILRHYPSISNRLTVVPNGGVSNLEAVRMPALEALRPYVLYVGSFSKRKNFPAVLAAARRLLAARDDLRFIFVGGSPAVFSEVDLGSEGQSERMIFAGQIDDPAQLLPYYCSAEALLFPSLYESSGLPPVEAMASGCPVVASNIPALVERCGPAAEYCNPLEEDDIDRALLAVLDSPDRRADLIRQGRDRSRLFTWRACAERTLKALSDSVAIHQAAKTGGSRPMIELPNNRL